MDVKFKRRYQMRALYNIFKYSILLAFFFFLLPSNVSAWWWNDDYQCDDVDADGIINVMTINLLFSEIDNRNLRLEAIADFADAYNVHVILLQEVAGGLLVETNNSAKDLQGILEDRGLNYNLKTAFETGLPGLLAVANAVLSRCEIKFSLVKRLSRATEIDLDGRVIRLPRNVQMVRLKIPGRGRISIYNTHWCAGCPPEELAVHWQESFEFCNNVESFLPGESPIIFGGDFNLDRFRTEIEGALYNNIVNDPDPTFYPDGQGFNDAYADFVVDDLESLCANKDVPDMHCTVDIISGEGSRRIDYLFIRNFQNFGVVDDAQVVFTPFNLMWPNPVSDHASVVISVKLQ
jgi:maltose 6'-phosphate phosphatase